MPCQIVRTMLGFALLALSLTAPIHGILPEIVNSEINQIIENNVAQGYAPLNDMFVEVEQLMEDTQQKLEDAVHQMDNESSRSSLRPTNLPSHSNNESSSAGSSSAGSSSAGSSSAESVARNRSFPMTETVDKEQENRTTLQSSEEQNNINHECIIDDDCQKGRYCLYETHQSKCLPCKALDVPCSKDEECCAGQLCVWGQCSQNNTKGEAGSICQCQSDCSPDLCCAFHKALLFPVCLAKPIERERCFASSNHLMELLSWDMEGEGPREHCPCSKDLQCQPLGRGSMCLKSQNSSEEDLTDTLYSEIDYIV